MRCIGATTPEEYRRLAELDAALERRMQPISVDEPSPASTREMLQGTKDALERHHGVEIDADALEAALHLSIRYVHHRKLPDKAMDALDEACR
jgi:ATP-dependent Clp protease ATP-binding subunit ClpA